MARIRSIKPEFFTDETVMELTVPARLLWIGLWCHADDAGNQDASVKQTRARIFPSDSIDIESCLTELQNHGLLREYSVNGKRYWNIPNFKKHQRINRPSPPRVPPPDRHALPEDSLKTHGGLTVGSGSGSGRDMDLTPHEDSLSGESSAAKTTAPVSSRSKDICTIESCKRRGSVRENGRWYCSQHSPDRDQQEQQQPVDLASILSDAEKFLRP